MDSAFFNHNRQKLYAALAADAPVVVTANGLLQRNADNSFVFAQDRNFWYLTGIDLPDITLVFDAAQAFLIVPDRTRSRETFDGAVEPAELTRLSGIGEVVDEVEGWQRLAALLNKQKVVHTLGETPAYLEPYGMYVNPARNRLLARLASQQTDLEVVDIRKPMAHLRMVKQPIELQAIQQAIDITNDSLKTLLEKQRLATYQNEYEIEADLSREFRFRGAKGHAFAPIVASGERACTMHNVENSGQLTKGSLVILDVGAEVSNYAADISRTVAFGTATSRQEDVFAAVLKVQSYALSLLKPGVLLREYEQQVETYLGSMLIQLGLLQKADRELIRKYYPHSASHFLGLDVHDIGDYELPLAAGMVITCEPGIYIPDEAIGVRLEDDVLITEDGNRVLSAALPSSLMYV